jgi:aldehyde:ferredoxin oxidoreductase
VAPGGCFGRALVVDVSDGSSRVLPLDEQVLRDHLGGVGLGTWLLTELGPPGVDPLAPEAPLASSSRRWSARR